MANEFPLQKGNKTNTFFVNKSEFRRIRSQSYMKAMAIKEEFDRVVQAQEKDRNRLFDNMKMYWGVDYGQWDRDQVHQILTENRFPVTINICTQKINTLSGSIVNNWYDVDYLPIDGKRTSLTVDFKDIYLSEKKIMQWDKSYLECVRNGLIMQGVEQMIVDRTYDPMGHIRFVTRPPGFTWFDPNWKSNRGSDCRKAWVVAYMTIKEISKKYGISEKELAIAAQLNMRQVAYSDYPNPSGYDKPGIDYGADLLNKIGNTYKVIEIHIMETVNTTRLVDFSKGTNGLPFPIMDPIKDREYLQEWGNANDVNWDLVKEVPHRNEILWITTIAPELSLDIILEDAPSEIQIKRLDLFPWSADRLNGKERGIIDIIKDPQQLINKHQSQKLHMINTAANGATLFNENLTDDVAKMNRILENKNNPSFVETVDLDAVQKTHVVLKDSPYDHALFQDQQFMFEIIDMISGVPAAMDARSESSKESGRLFGYKVAVAELGQKTLQESLKWHQYDKAMAFYLQSQHTFRDTYRKFPRLGGNGSIEINKPVDVNGQNYIRNNIGALPMFNVVINESPRSLTQRNVNRIMYSDLLQSMPPELTLQRTFVATLIIETLDNSEEQKEILKKINDMSLIKALIQHQSEIKQMLAGSAQAEVVIAQSEATIKQLMQAMGQPATLPGEEGPVPEQLSPEGAEPPALPAPPEAAPTVTPEGSELLAKEPSLETEIIT